MHSNKLCNLRCGLRPPNSDNLDINYRSLIIVFSTKMSMKPYFDIFMQNINSTVTKLMSYVDNTIVRFTIVDFITGVTNLNSYNNYDEFYEELQYIQNNSFRATIYPYQDLLGSLLFAQQTKDNTAFSQIWLFADSFPLESFAENTLMPANNIEHQLIQAALAWRTKLTVILCQNDTRPLSVKKNKHYDVLRRVVRSTHGDLHLVNAEELGFLMSNVLTTYNNAEDVAAYYDLKPGASISLEAHPDDIHRPIYLLYTIWPDSGVVSSPTIDVTNANKNNLGSTKHLWFYRFLSTGGIMNITISSAPNVSFYVRCFYQTRSSVVVAFSSNKNADFGNEAIYAGIPTWSSARPLDIDSVANISRIIRTSDGYPLTEEVIFLLERSTLLQQESANIFGLLNASLPTWEWIFKPKQYGLMVFDDQDIQTLINTFDVKDFLRKLQVTLANLAYKETNSNRVLDAIYIRIDFMNSIFYETQLVADERIPNCLGGANFSFMVDRESRYVVLQVNGIGSTVQVIDANNLNINLYLKGQWTAKIATNEGPCGLQVRIIGPYSIIPGFAISNSDDFPHSQLFGARGFNNGGAAMMFRVTMQMQGNPNMTLRSVSYLGTSVEKQFNESLNDLDWGHASIYPKDNSTCSYQWTTDIISADAKTVELMNTVNVNAEITTEENSVRIQFASTEEIFRGESASVPAVTNASWPTVPPHDDETTTALPTTSATLTVTSSAETEQTCHFVYCMLNCMKRFQIKLMLHRVLLALIPNLLEHKIKKPQKPQQLSLVLPKEY
ncbi:hypothetical protein WR25_13031 [Diploscapter pachys]|uniref:Uncharacterized protein n=1 Tax=Diploscapter pachys TaxID=2018661 RepID=A0A2A2JUC4_9BILA|nr:hypothetical protein WR25_13031 [Diploscapter pachys]